MEYDAGAPSPVTLSLTPEEWTAVLLSLKIATVATLASLPFGIVTAWLLARGRFPGKILLDGLVHLPLVLPPVVTGFVLLLLFGRQGPIGAFLAESIGLVFAFRWTGAALACAVMGFPLMVRAIRLAIEAVDPRLEAAAATLGANRMLVFLVVTLPLAWPGVIAGVVLAFAKSLGEFGATITFVSNIPGETQTISAAIYGATQTPAGDPSALRLTLVATALAFAALIVSEWLSRRGRRRGEGER
jgi:molybdate transport system permease protein